MNNDLEQFSEERLKKMTIGHIYPTTIEMAALARIALSAKQAKPVGHFSRVNGDGIWFEQWTDKLGLPLYTTPQPAHTEQDGWTSSDAANAALVMLDMIDTTDPVDDDRIEGIQRIIRQLVNSPAIPVGWKLVPIEPTEKMKAAAEGEYSLKLAYKAMLRAAPKPESE